MRVDAKRASQEVLSPAPPSVVAAFSTAMIGGLVTLAAEILGLPPAVGLIGVATLIAGSMVTGVLVHRFARRTGRSFARALRGGAWTTLRTILDFLP